MSLPIRIERSQYQRGEGGESNTGERNTERARNKSRSGVSPTGYTNGGETENPTGAHDNLNDVNNLARTMLKKDGGGMNQGRPSGESLDDRIAERSAGWDWATDLAYPSGNPLLETSPDNTMIRVSFSDREVGIYKLADIAENLDTLDIDRLKDAIRQGAENTTHRKSREAFNNYLDNLTLGDSEQ